ncbi:MAG: translocation/assembly module TamB domain-containing protein [Desulfobaccales bacterium]
MRRVAMVMVSLVLLLSLGGTAAGAVLPDLTNWGGPFLLSLIQSKVNGQVTAREISGNPLSGVVFKDLTITDPAGKVLLNVDRFEARLSLASIPNFRLDLGALALENPRVYLFREPSGQWNFSWLIKPEEKPAKPAEPQGLVGKITQYLFQGIDLSNVSVHRGELFITEGGRTSHYTDLDLKSSLSLLDWGQPQQKIKIDISSLGITTPQGRAELEARLTYSSGLAQIRSLNLKLAGQTVASLQGEVCRPLTELSCSLAGKIGPIKGDQIQAFWPRWPAPWDLAGTLSLSSTSDGGKILVKGKIGEAACDLTGDLDTKVKPAVFKLDLDLKGLTTAQLKEIQDLKGQPVQGLSPVNAHLRLEGTGLPWNPASLKTRLDLAPFQYRDLKVDKVRLDLSGTVASQELQASVAGNFGTVDLGASGHLLPVGETGQGLSGNLTVQTGDFQPAMLGVARLAGSSLTTCFTGKFRLPPGVSPAQAYLAGDLRASGRVQKEPLKDLNASFVLEGKKLTVSRADVQLAGLTASWRGSLTESGVDVTFNASLSGSGILPLPPGAAFASLAAEGAVRGPWKAPQVNLAAQVRKASFQGLTLESANLNGALAGWPSLSGNLQVLGTGLRTPGGTFTRVHLNAGGDGGRWQFQVAATSPNEPKFEATGTAELAARPLVLNVARLSWQSQALTFKNKTPFTVRLLPGWEISPATFQVDGGSVTVAGMARDQQLSGVLEVRDLNAGLLAPLGLPASGKLNGRLTLAGTPRTPTIDGQIALSNGKVKNLPIQTLTTTLNYQAEQAQVAGYLEIGPLHSRLIWRGSVPVKISLLPFACALAQDGLDLRLHSERVNLSLLTSISKEVQTAEGPMDMMMEARGNPHQPRVSGYVRWSAGSLKLHQAGTPYALAPGEIRLQGEKIVIPGLVLQSDGTIRLSGEILLAGAPQAQVRLQAENFLLLDRGGNEAWTNGFIDLKGPLSALVASGRLVVPKAQFRPTFFRSDMEPDVILVPVKPKPQDRASVAPVIYRNLRVDIALENSGNAWLVDPMGKVEMLAHLKIRKDPGQKLAMAGEVRALKGTLDIEERTFTVKQALLQMPGATGKPITVEGSAVHQMEDITLMLTVKGTMSNPLIRLESLPPLPPADVLSYLVFGAPSATLNKEQYMALGAQQLGVLGGISANKISEILGSAIPFLGGIKVRSGMLGGRPTVGVGKEITNNVSVFAGRNLNEERGVYEQQVGIQYKVNKNLSVESQLGHRNSGADVLFNYDF